MVNQISDYITNVINQVGDSFARPSVNASRLFGTDYQKAAVEARQFTNKTGNGQSIDNRSSFLEDLVHEVGELKEEINGEELSRTGERSAKRAIERHSKVLQKHGREFERTIKTALTNEKKAYSLLERGYNDNIKALDKAEQQATRKVGDDVKELTNINRKFREARSHIKDEFEALKDLHVDRVNDIKSTVELLRENEVKIAENFNFNIAERGAFESAEKAGSHAMGSIEKAAAGAEKSAGKGFGAVKIASAAAVAGGGALVLSGMSGEDGPNVTKVGLGAAIAGGGALGLLNKLPGQALAAAEHVHFRA